MNALQGKRVLVVDDEADIREQLSLSLSMGTYRIETAAGGQQAIELGASYRPDVLVTDWLLKNHYHGLHVFQALQAVAPELETILITGYASMELRERAESLGVFRFLEKPFEPDDLLEAVGDAAISRRRRRGEIEIPVVEIDGSGRILYANPRGRQLFGRTNAGRRAKCLEDLFGSRCLEILDEDAGWARVTPLSSDLMTWHAHGRRLSESRWLVVFLDGDEAQHLMIHPLVHLLVKTAPQAQWPFAVRALLIDADDMARRTAHSLFDRGGGLCHLAGGMQQGLRMVERDDGIRVIIIGAGFPEEEVVSFAERAESIRDGVVLIGSGGPADRKEMMETGVELFLKRPWHLDDLVALLTRRIEKCRGCDAGLPLREAIPGERPARWECRQCGHVHTGLIDRSAQDALQNVRPLI